MQTSASEVMEISKNLKIDEGDQQARAKSEDSKPAEVPDSENTDADTNVSSAPETSLDKAVVDIRIQTDGVKHDDGDGDEDALVY